jgi:hypothetical protein
VEATWESLFGVSEGSEDKINVKSVRFIMRMWNLSASEICPVADVFLRTTKPSDFARSSTLISLVLRACKTGKFILTIEALTRI